MAANSQLMPAKHRDQLRTLVVLKGYSCIACGSGMKAIDQQKKLYDFVYGKPPNKPSQYEGSFRLQSFIYTCSSQGCE